MTSEALICWQIFNNSFCSNRSHIYSLSHYPTSFSNIPKLKSFLFSCLAPVVLKTLTWRANSTERIVGVSVASLNISIFKSVSKYPHLSNGKFLSGNGKRPPTTSFYNCINSISSLNVLSCCSCIGASVKLIK